MVMAAACAGGGTVQRFGFNAFETPQTAAMARSLGATVMRMMVPWEAIETAPGRFNWTTYDQNYRTIVAGGLRPSVVPVGSPCWARPSVTCNDAQYPGPPDPSYDAAWIDFVHRVTARYPESIGIEVWNEPNLLSMFWPRVDPVRYTQLLKEAYGAIKSVNRAMPVVSGGLAPAPIQQRKSFIEGDQIFLAAMYAAGAGSAIDAIGAHPYPIHSSPDGTSSTWDPPLMEQMLARLRAARASAPSVARHLFAAAVTPLPIWITEVGESTTTQGGFPLPVSPARQATDLVAMLKQAKADHDIPVVIVHSLLDQGAGYNDPYNGVLAGFGAFTSNATPKPAACALSALWGGRLHC